MKIDNNFLREYISLDREIKDKTKKRNQMKKEIDRAIEERNGKSIITRFFIATHEITKRIKYNIPDEIKQKYKEENEYKILKVTERKPEAVETPDKTVEKPKKKTNAKNEQIKTNAKM